MDYLSHNIARNLKRLRLAKGLSLEAAAEQTGVSKSMLAHIEKGGANPSIGVVGKIASGLRVEFSDLIGAPPLDARLVRMRETEPTKDVPGQYRVWTGFPFQDTHRAELYRIELFPGGRYPAGSHGERTCEYLAVTEGTLELELTDGVYTVEAEELFRFESSQRHVYRNGGDAPCVFLCFFVEYGRPEWPSDVPYIGRADAAGQAPEREAPPSPEA